MARAVLAALIAMSVPAAGGPLPPSVPAARVDPADPALAALRARAALLAQGTGSRVGVAAIDLATGQLVSVNGSERFPMASTVKIAIAAAFLHQVQKGRLTLDASYTLPGSERQLARRVGDMQRHSRGLSGATLLDLMLTRSDNTAADILLGALGGTRAVGDWLHSAGLLDQRVDRSIAQLLDDRQTWKRVRVGKGRHRHWATIAVPRAIAAGDPRDSSTPEAMATLLAKLRGGELLDRERTEYLFAVMARCRTGPNRIRGLLPPGTPVAHKTGTMTGITDDVGIVSLPNGHDLAIAVFEQGRGGPAAQSRNIARLARLLYDGFAAVPEQTAQMSVVEPAPAGS